MNIKYYFLFIWLILISCSTTDNDPVINGSNDDDDDKDDVEQVFRDPLKWPFSQNSIWNMPIGSEAVYVHAKIQKAMKAGLTNDEDYIVLRPDAPLVDIYLNHAEWDPEKDRCTIDGGILFSAPIPKTFIVSPETWRGTTPNAGLAVLMPDNRTIKQTQPFSFCDPTQGATSKFRFDDVDIFGDGIHGAHGGSGLSAIGGALRVGELTPTSGPIRHALKVNLFGGRNLFYDEDTKGFRWPAKVADAYAHENYGTLRTDPVKECRMGALLAIPADYNLHSFGFETEPGLILAEAFQNYGAYIVDDTAWDVYALVTEWGPDGRFEEEFKKNWGFNFSEYSKNTPWSRDIDRIFLNLHVIDNNSPTSVGGGGTPLMPLAPQFK